MRKRTAIVIGTMGAEINLKQLSKRDPRVRLGEQEVRIVSGAAVTKLLAEKKLRQRAWAYVEPRPQKAAKKPQRERK
jgi:hypothetical protein